MTPEQKHAYDQATDSVKSLFSSFEAAQFNKRLIELYKIPETKVSTFLEMTGDVVLGLSDIATLPEQLKKVGIDDANAAKITNAFLNYLEEDTETKTASDIDIATYMQDEKEGGHTQSSTTATSPVSNLRTGSIRTMGQDVNSLKDAPQPTQTAAASTQDSGARSEPPHTPEAHNETIVKSLSQAELQGKNASVPDYTKSE